MIDLIVFSAWRWQIQGPSGKVATFILILKKIKAISKYTIRSTVSGPSYEFMSQVQFYNFQ